jgi:hypothetical protein
MQPKKTSKNAVCSQKQALNYKPCGNLIHDCNMLQVVKIAKRREVEACVYCAEGIQPQESYSYDTNQETSYLDENRDHHRSKVSILYLNQLCAWYNDQKL